MGKQESCFDGVLSHKKDFSKIIYKINDTIIVESEQEMISEVIKLIKSGIDINGITVTKDGEKYYDEYNRTIQEIIKMDYL